jgi:hypothetical protein
VRVSVLTPPIAHNGGGDLHLRHGDHRSKGWRLHEAWIGTVHRQGKMGPPGVILTQVAGQDVPEMTLTEHDDMVQALPSDTPMKRFTHGFCHSDLEAIITSSVRVDSWVAPGPSRPSTWPR